MHLENYRIVFIAIGLIGILLFAAPTIGLLVTPPSGEQFSELYILGPNHKLEDFPFNIKAGLPYTVYLGESNQIGASSYYTCFVKLRNGTDPLPNATSGTPSSVRALYEYTPFIKNGGSWETPLTFQFNSLSFTDDTSHLSSVTINGIDFPVNKEAGWNSDKAGYYYGIFVELWIYNSTLRTDQYHNRFVHFNLYIAN